MLKNYLVSGRFEVYDENGILITDQFFLNKIIEKVSFPEAAKNMALEFMKRRAKRRYGKHAIIKEAGNIALKHTLRNPGQKKKRKKPKENKEIQENLF